MRRVRKISHPILTKRSPKLDPTEKLPVYLNMKRKHVSAEYTDAKNGVTLGITFAVIVQILTIHLSLISNASTIIRIAGPTLWFLLIAILIPIMLKEETRPIRWILQPFQQENARIRLYQNNIDIEYTNNKWTSFIQNINHRYYIRIKAYSDHHTLVFNPTFHNTHQILYLDDDNTYDFIQYALAHNWRIQLDNKKAIDRYGPKQHPKIYDTKSV